MQEEGVKVPPALDVQLTVPEGEFPVTVTVHMEEDPRDTVEGEQASVAATAWVTVPIETEGMTPFGG